MLSRRFLRIKALKALYSHYSIADESIIESRNKMLHSVAKSYELYFLLSKLIVKVADYAEEHIEILKSKHLATPEEKDPNMRFVDNPFIELIRENEQLNKYIEKNDIYWNDNRELFIQLYNSMIGRKYYSDYMQNEDNSFDSHRNMVLMFYKKELEDNTLLMSILEDMSIYWVDEMEFIASKVISTYVDWTEQKQDILNKYIDKSDEQYLKDLLTYSIINFPDTVEKIKMYSKNWDIDRVTIMDKIIITMATSEFLEFPSIPINVSIDEYIEISKFYSTANSSIYINGIIDKILTTLRREEKINKSGRGLKEGSK